MNTAKQNLRYQKVVAGIAVILFGIKIGAWIITGSVAVLTDALESVVNIVAGFFGVFSLYLSSKPRDFEHPYGHGKIEFISSAVEGTLIFLAGIFIIYKAIANFFHPEPLQKLDLGMWLLAISAIINWVAGNICVRVGKKNKSVALVASGKHIRVDAFTTLGIFVGLFLVIKTGALWIDSLVALLFAGVILITGYRIIRSSVAGIMDEQDIELLKDMVQQLEENRKPDWIDLHNMRIIKYGAILHMDCHMTVPWYYNVVEAHAIVEELTDLVKKNFGTSMEVFVHSDACMEFSCPICTKMDCPVRVHLFEKKIKWTITSIAKNNKHDINT